MDNLSNNQLDSVKARQWQVEHDEATNRSELANSPDLQQRLIKINQTILKKGAADDTFKVFGISG